MNKDFNGPHGDRRGNSALNDKQPRNNGSFAHWPREGRYSEKWNGRQRTPTYSTWASMKARCLTPSTAAYPRYGAKGITVCERWMTFENFLADMGHKPEGLSIDRIDNTKGYSPDNCRWATRSEQNRNRRPYKIKRKPK